MTPSKTRILVATDFSPEADVAADHALAIARHTGGELVLVHAGVVTDAPRDHGYRPASVAVYEEALAQRVAHDRALLQAKRERLAGQGAQTSQAIVDGIADLAICQAAEEMSAHLVVVGTHGRTGVKRFLLGSVAERIVRSCPTNVLVARPLDEGKVGYRKILVATDFSQLAERALALACEIANKDAHIKLIHFWSVPGSVGTFYPSPGVNDAAFSDLAKDVRQIAAEQGERLIQKYQTAEMKLSFEVVQAAAAQGIQDHAEGHDLIAVGSHGRSGFRRLLLGSVSEKTVRHAPCSVLVAHSGDNAAAL